MTDCFASNFWLESFSFACHLQVVFSTSVFLRFWQQFWNFSVYQQHQLPLALQIPTNQHPRVLQVGRHILSRKEWRFPQTLVQVLQNHALFGGQYLCNREVQECLMQPFYTLISIKTNIGDFSKHESKSSYSHRDKGNLLTRHVLQINVYAVKRVF